VRFPRDAARFEVQPLSDSTITFEPSEASWVRAGMIGVAVDPARGDALVGKLRVLAVRDGRAEALVTGQTTRLAAGHVLLLVAPRRAWWRQPSFWWGVAAGSVLVSTITLF
jgi:ligand-binding sensor domain-containing protein